MSKIITVSREFGSGGRELGRRLAEELGIQYYDKEIVGGISEDTEMTESYVKSMMTGKNRRLFPITIGQSFAVVPDYHMFQMQSIYKSQTEIITKLAEQGDCVIIGRCADFVLRDMKPFRIFVYADMESRINRCKLRDPENERLTDEQYRKKILTVDKERARYYYDFTGQNWGDMHSYDMCINASNLVIKDIVPHLAKMF